MQLGLLVSSLLHAMILLAAVIVLPAPERFKVTKIESLPVDLLTIAEFTKLQAKTRPEKKPVAKVKPKPAPKPVQKEAPKKTEPAPKPEPEPAPKPEPAPPKAAVPPPKPEPKPEPKPKPKPKPKVSKKPETKLASVPLPRRKPKPPRRKAKPERKFNPDKIAALLNKVPDQAPEPEPPAPSTQGALRGVDMKLTLSELDALRTQISQCWSPPIGVENAQDLQIRLKLKLRRDGKLAAPPELINSSSDPMFGLAAESAIRAVIRCQKDGYQMPPDKYETWRDVHVTFDPREMFGR